MAHKKLWLGKEDPLNEYFDITLLSVCIARLPGSPSAFRLGHPVYFGGRERAGYD
jgi:hypothetical protein